MEELGRGNIQRETGFDVSRTVENMKLSGSPVNAKKINKKKFTSKNIIEN